MFLECFFSALCDSKSVFRFPTQWGENIFKWKWVSEVFTHLLHILRNFFHLLKGGLVRCEHEEHAPDPRRHHFQIHGSRLNRHRQTAARAPAAAGDFYTCAGKSQSRGRLPLRFQIPLSAYITACFSFFPSGLWKVGQLWNEFVPTNFSHSGNWVRVSLKQLQDSLTIDLLIPLHL